MFTKFSIWEHETNELIKKVSLSTNIPESHIKNWMHKEGPLLGIKLQEESLSKTTNETITTEFIIHSKKMAFLEIKKAFLATLLQNPLNHDVASLFDKYIESAISNHLDFYKIQADIANEINTQSQRSNLTPYEKGTLSIQKYTEYKKKNPELTHKIDSHIQFMKEFIIMMKTIHTNENKESHKTVVETTTRNVRARL